MDFIEQLFQFGSHLLITESFKLKYYEETLY